MIQLKSKNDTILFMLNKRQKAILELIEQRTSVTARQILDAMSAHFERTSKPTIIRDIGVLLKLNLIEKRGHARSVVYVSLAGSPLLKYIDAQRYFLESQDERDAHERFQWEVFENARKLFTNNELHKLRSLNERYLKNKAKLDPGTLKKELERITIELSWKSSQLEGNTYSLIDTEILIKEAREAAGHTKEEATMILNHKQALDFIFTNAGTFKKLTLPGIRSVHSLLVKNLGIPDDFRKSIVGITGTNYKPLDNQFQIKEALESAVAVINKEIEPVVKALLSLAFISYIQPFVDGNKRTSRLSANAVLLSHDWCPMSLRSMDAAEYKKAILLFYEQNNIRYLKELFMQQFEFAVNNYFG